MQGVSAPVIPMYMDNIWGSIFSFHEGRYFWKIPKNSIYPLTVVFGRPLPPDTKSHAARVAVQELGATACRLRGVYRKKLHLAFIDSVKNQPHKLCMADSTGMRLSYLQALAASLLIKAKLFPRSRKVLESGEMIGVMLPASVMAAVVNAAVMMAESTGKP